MIKKAYKDQEKFNHYDNKKDVINIDQDKLNII
jgi:hypothetical protein